MNGMGTINCQKGEAEVRKKIGVERRGKSRVGVEDKRQDEWIMV